MTAQSSRRAFLTGTFAETPVLRPPGAPAEPAFLRACTGCGACIDACPNGIVAADRAGRPVLSLARDGCTFCGACIRSCTPGALRPDQPWPWRAATGRDCLSLNGIQCRACEDHCETRAIRFRLIPGGRAQPVLDPDACNGCGACVAPCPAGAIGLVATGPEAETSPC